MSTWYEPYLVAFEREVQTVPDIVCQVKEQLQLFRSPDPLVSIVVIAYNEAPRILACLWSLSKQICDENMELIVVNNNSTDGTEQVLKELDVVYYNETRQGPGFARQCGLDQAKGEYIICIDADTLYPPHYIDTHLRVLRHNGVSCVFSLWSFLPNQGQSAFSLWMYEWLRDCYLNIQYIKRPELCVRGMTFSFKSNYGRQVGFRTDVRRGEDGSLALALKPYGKIVFIRRRKARVMTGQYTIGADGSLWNSFKIRLQKGMSSLGGLFFKKEHYQDEDTNLIK